MGDEPAAPTPSLDDAARIDPEALQRWFAVPPEAKVALVATRYDMDGLFLGLRHILFAQGAALAALQLYSHGEAEKANAEHLEAVRKHAEALALISRFTGAIMAKAEPYE